MMRVGMSQLAAIDHDAIADHASPASDASPFRAALRAANKSDKERAATRRADDDAQTTRRADDDAQARRADHDAGARSADHDTQAPRRPADASAPIPQPARPSDDTRASASELPRPRAAAPATTPAAETPDLSQITPTELATLAALPTPPTTAPTAATPSSVPTPPATRSSGPATPPEGNPMPDTSIELISETATATLSGLETASEHAASAHHAPPIRTGAGTDSPPVAAGAQPDAGAAAALAASLGLIPGAAATQTQVAPITPPSTPPSTNTSDAGPVSALLAASTGRALGAPGKPAPDAAAATAPAPVAPATSGLETMAMTPLEQAVHELIGRIAEHDTAHIRATKPPADDIGDAELAPFHMLASAHVAAARDPAAPATAIAHAAAPTERPEPPANPSHVHLVLDDGAERTVVTVAMRGTEVHVAMRSTDDATASALARNAASLDHAMRARGLVLGELTAEREPSERRSPRDPDPRDRRERPTDPTKPFKLEETP